MRTLLIATALVSVAGCKCAPEMTSQGRGEIGVVYMLEGVEVTRPNGVYDFHGIAMGSTVTGDVTLTNTGSGLLDLESFTKASGDDSVFTHEFIEGTQLGPAETVKFKITFTAPASMDEQKAFSAHYTLRAANTEEGKETADIELKGIAVKAECALPDTIDFGGVAVGQTETRTLKLQNLTSLDTEASLGAITSSNGDHNSIKYGPGWGEGELNLAPGTVKDLTFRFSPSQTATYSALVTLKLADHCPAKTVRLIGSGVQAAVSCAPLDFAFLPVGLTRSQTTTLTNYSLTDVTVSALAPSLPDYAPAATSVTVPAAQRVMTPNGLQLQPGTAMLSVEFRPTKIGTLTGVIQGTTSLPSQPNAGCPVTGSGGGPDIELKPSGAIDLGAVPFFATAPEPFFVTRKLTIQNLGTSPNPPDLRANLKLGMNGAPPTYWRVTPKNPESTTAEICVGFYDSANPNPAARCANGPGSGYDPMVGLPASGAFGLLDVPIRVMPDGPNKTLEWEVEIFSNDPDEPSVKLTVRARSVVMPPCTYQVVPANLQFGLLAPPNQRDLTFEIRNVGMDACLITHLELAPLTDATYSLVRGELDQFTVMPGGSVPVTVRATASGAASTALRQVLGAVRFGISSPFAPQTDVSLTASIGLPCLTIAPSDLDFGTVRQGCDSSRRVFTVYNTCATPVTLNGWRVSAGAGQVVGGPNCPGPAACPEFLIDTPPSIGMGMPIPPAAPMPVTFALKYHPIDLGRDNGVFTLDVTQNGGSRVDMLVTLKGTGDLNGQNVDTFAQDPRPKADVLFIIDSSCSMYDKQQLLSQNFAAFISYATTAVPGGLDYHLGVIDSDPRTDTGGKLRFETQNPRVITNSMPNAEALFRTRVRVGIGGSGNEQFADLAVRALTAPLVNTDNAGFLRADAVLAIVAVTDADDQSQLPTNVLVGLLSNIKGAQRPQMFSYNVIGPFAPSHPPGCIYDDFVLNSPPRLHDDLVNAFDGTRGQICEQNWSGQLTQVGRTAFGYRDRFYLNATPDLTQMPPFTITLDGINVPETDMGGAVIWSYDPASNSVHFTSQYVPEPGQTLTVAYRVLCN